ncbi:LOW QUALITY PROTEIN: hypothetical protein CVT26_005652 [Gymnopilus dilepis]|uniref:Uncharacterized protein n=1 Tax=Gymnopilus dilepis TaxID=231916 RepID=A0A409XZW4_9AGAR|nr:LOW QUALITY PROTEIN: hypothetical protein CVT26_005652 [Gymnopilus dilepis]
MSAELLLDVDGAGAPSSTNGQGILLIHLIRDGKAVDHARVKFRDTYDYHGIHRIAKKLISHIEGALDVVCEVFEDVERADLDLRQKIPFGKILPREWADIIKRPFDEIGVFSRESLKKKPPTDITSQPRTGLLHLIDNRNVNNVEKQRFVVPLPGTYELCQQVAFELMNWRYLCSEPSEIALMGRFPGVKGGVLLGTLTSESYPTFIRSAGVIEIVVGRR